MWGKKGKQCDPDDPDDAAQGSQWDHVIIDPETKLIVSLVVGRRNADTVVQVFGGDSIGLLLCRGLNSYYAFKPL